jgi:hypothetical protein
MSFEILTISGETRMLRHEDITAQPALSNAHPDFVDACGHRYSGSFDGKNVTFNDGAVDWVGGWVQGTSATIIRNTKLLPDGFTFTFMDHGPGPQRLHAVWTFKGSVEEVIAGWRLAGFSLSRADRTWNRNHPASTHLRTKGGSLTGADSSHAIIPVVQTEMYTTGEIHVGEFNPLTGFGIGFVLHQLEDWIWKHRSINSCGHIQRNYSCECTCHI